VSTTIHLVYPSGPAISCPDAIGRNVAERLGRRHRVIHHEWDALGLVRPGPDAILLGHPHPAPWTLFRMSSRLPGWKRIVVMCPYASGSVGQVAFLDGAVRRADRYLAITGPYWARRVAAGPFSHWSSKIEPMDLAVSRRDFPRVKGAFERPGRRRFLYIGNTSAPKNTGYLSAIARAMPEAEVAWAGTGRSVEGVRPLGQLDFAKPAAREVVAGFDFLLTVGSSDANPATVLEAMAWGLVPICTPQSGYEDEPGIVNVPLGDVAAAVRVLRDVQLAPAERLEALRAAGDEQLGSRFTWDRFNAQVEVAVESRESRKRIPLSWKRRARLAMASTGDPHSALRPANALGLLRSNLARWSARSGRMKDPS